MAEQLTIKAAMIRREWIESARAILTNPAQRCAFYDAICDIALGMESATPGDPTTAAMVAMCRPAIVSDLERYAERVERTRAAADARKQARQHTPTDTPAGAVNINTSTSTTTNNTTNTNINLSQSAEPIGERERYLIFGILFGKGCLALEREYDAWYAYYDALGWRNNKGAPILSRPSAASMWRPSCDCAQDLEHRSLWRKVFQGARTNNTHIWTDYRGLLVAEEEGVSTLIILTAMQGDMLDRFDGACIPQLQALCAELGCSRVVYQYRP